MKSLQQVNIDNYHNTIKNLHHGHDMHIMHRDWHEKNVNPNLDKFPEMQDPNWSVNEEFGSNFLQMHHEMIKARPTESHKHMEHASIAEWYSEQGLSLPSLWNPLNVIPKEL